jgi:Rrf2 family nitric oxide-sensitive transcriptional repressor
MFSNTVEYALLGMAQLASQECAASTVQRVSKATRISLPYLAKVFQDLGKAGLIEAKRGRNGGIKLAKPASRITLLDVVEALEPMNRAIDPLHGAAKASMRRLDVSLDGFLKSLRMELATVTLANVYVMHSPAKPKARKRIA